MLADNAPLAEEWLPPMTAGDALGAVALAGDSGSYDIARISTAWERSGDTVRLSGTSGFVLDAAGAAMLVVAARDADGTVAAIAVEPDQRGVQIERCRTVDETRQLSTVSFDAVVVGGSRMLCEPGAAAEALLDRVLAIGVVAAACDAAGVAEQALARAAAYASERVQFGKPIGSFQAVKHHCANMAIAVEASKAATRAAAEALDRDPAEWGATAAIAASYAGPACSEACALGLLVHGGIGFTWEQDSHLYLKRAKLDEVLFGTPSWHRRRLADAVFPTLIAS
jgi:alkylation response protein AidB-like acyl-CoA dehydrogenase